MSDAVLVGTTVDRPGAGPRLSRQRDGAADARCAAFALCAAFLPRLEKASLNWRARGANGRRESGVACRIRRIAEVRSTDRLEVCEESLRTGANILGWAEFPLTHRHYPSLIARYRCVLERVERRLQPPRPLPQTASAPESSFHFLVEQRFSDASTPRRGALAPR